VHLVSFNRCRVGGYFALLALILSSHLHAQTTVSGADGLRLWVDSSGWFEILPGSPPWDFAGNLGHPLFNVKAASGEDPAGAYNEISFDYAVDGPRHASIRCYLNRKAVLFSVRYLSQAANSAPFPVFSRYPQALGHLTFSGMFAMPTFGGFAGESPWVFFDPSGNTFVLSPAANFMTAITDWAAGNGILSAISPQIATLPEGFEHKALLVIDKGINSAFDSWGRTLTALGGKTRPPNDADTILNRIGYWTDAGATYYYHHDPSLSYRQTLAAVRSEFDSAGVPLGYMQLDSWFYPKGAKQDWTDSSSGIYRYAAADALFDSGLGSFDKTLGLPLVTHARWIDPSSPYRQQYRISGNVAIDPQYWGDIAGYLAGAGVIGYEQDWLSDKAHANFNLTDPDAFLDGMAAGMAQQGLTMQYCMATPRHFLKGSKYGNLTTIRVSQDRFTPDRWTNFLYASRLGSALGIWPFTDVFMSAETGNLLVATLSAGPVGLGDAIGTVNASNLLRAARGDGVIVKPDIPLAPLDRVFQADSQGAKAPMVAAAYTAFGGQRAWYLFGYPRGSDAAAGFTPSELGVASPVYVYDYLADSGRVAAPGDFVTGTVKDGFSYAVAVPIGPSGIAVIGDTGHFVTLGRKRIADYSDDGKASLTIAFARNETLRTIQGYSPSLPAAVALEGRTGPVVFDNSTGRFSMTVSPGPSGTATIRISRRHPGRSMR
jgi:hypothetical protein